MLAICMLTKEAVLRVRLLVSLPRTGVLLGLEPLPCPLDNHAFKVNLIQKY